MTAPRAARRRKSKGGATFPAPSARPPAAAAPARGGLLARRDRVAVAALLGAAFALYFATSSAHLAGGDNAEFVTIFAGGGVAHPPGYPLYCILLRLFGWMPGGAILGASRVTAVLGAVSVAALYPACRAWGASFGASLVAAASYALSPLAWRLATQAEVFALHALFAALLLFAAAPGVAMAPARRVLVLAGLAGLALSNHLTIVLLAPVGLLAATRALLAAPSRPRVALLGAASFGAGLLPYLYCYAVGRAPDGGYVWGDPGTWGGLWRHVLRADYGTFHLTGADATPEPLANVAVFFAQTASHTVLLASLVGLFGCARLYARASARPRDAAGPSAPTRGDVLALAATWMLAGPLFAALLNAPSDAQGTLVERFCLLPEVVLTIAVAWGLDAWRALRDSRAVALALAGAEVVATGVFHSWPQVRAEHTNVLELYTENTEKSAPPRAVILGTGDYRLFSFLYADAIKLRPDVTYIDPHLLGYDWYRRRVSRELGAPIAAPAHASSDALALIAQAFSLGRPVLLTDIVDPQVVKAFASYPLGTLIRLLPPGAPLPPPEGVEAQNLDVFARYRRWDPVAREDAWVAAVLPTYQRPWIAVARMFEKRGDAGRATANRDRAEEWGR
jgi:hypothetical protein